MSEKPVARIRAVGTVEEHRVSYDSSTGEVCPNCAIVRRDVDSLEAELRLKRRKIAELERNRDRHAEASEHFTPAAYLFAHWQIVCERRKSPWSTLRFLEVEPFMRSKSFGRDMVRRAIDGAAYQSWVSLRSNGTVKWHNDWQKIFESPGSVEEHCNRAPKGWTLAFSAEMEHWPIRRPGAEHVGGWFGIRPPAGWKPPAQETPTGQVAMLSVVDD